MSRSAWRTGPALLAIGATLALGACSTGAGGDPSGSAAPSTPSSPAASVPTPSSNPAATPPAPERPERPESPSASPSPEEPGATDSAEQPRVPRTRRPPDPRWLYFEDDTTRYASPWWTGRHRLQIAFGCTPAPYYVLDPRCEGTGYHHGYDFAIPCGTPLRAGRPARVVSSTGLGPAYGENALLLRMTDDDGLERDVVIGHTRRNLVAEGDTIRAGQRFAYASDSAVFTGCHLHFEVRPAGGSVSSAVDPRPLLELRPRRDAL